MTEQPSESFKVSFGYIFIEFRVERLASTSNMWPTSLSSIEDKLVYLPMLRYSRDMGEPGYNWKLVSLVKVLNVRLRLARPSYGHGICPSMIHTDLVRIDRRRPIGISMPGPHLFFMRLGCIICSPVRSSWHS